MTQYKLIYFDARGRAETARFIFAQAGVNYEDKRVSHENWPALKPRKIHLTTAFNSISDFLSETDLSQRSPWVSYQLLKSTAKFWDNRKPSAVIWPNNSVGLQICITLIRWQLAIKFALYVELLGKDDWEAALSDAYVDSVDDVTQNLRPWFMEKDAEKKVC